MQNILIVDDDKEIVKAIEIYLERKKYQIFKAYDGIEALEQIKQNDINLIILDIMMPNKDGIETSKYIYSNYFIARKIAELERKKIISEVSQRFTTNIYTHNETPYLPYVNNMGSVDYYNIMPLVFRYSKINLNITLRSIRSGMPLRAIDIMGAGGFLLTNYQSDFLKDFVPGEDMVMYDSVEDCISKCEYYLKHEDERKSIALNGYKKVKEKYNYVYRIKQILDIVDSR